MDGCGRSYRSIVFGLAALLLTAPGARAGTITLDFSEPGVGPFDPNYFASQGVIFQPGLAVGFLSGDEALGSRSFGDPGPLAASISGGLTTEISRISIRLSTTFQVVEDFQLAIFDLNTNLISRTTFRANSIIGDPGFTGIGYFTLDSGPISTSASSFLILGQFVRSPVAVGSEFGVSTITLTTVPEPPGIALLAFGVLTAGILRKLQT